MSFPWKDVLYKSRGKKMDKVFLNVFDASVEYLPHQITWQKQFKKQCLTLLGFNPLQAELDII